MRLQISEKSIALFDYFNEIASVFFLSRFSLSRAVVVAAVLFFVLFVVRTVLSLDRRSFLDDVDRALICLQLHTVGMIPFAVRTY